MRREAKWQILWGKYVRERAKAGEYFYYELKQTGMKSLFFSLFEPHQIASLLALQERGLTWKLSDADPRLKPCDGFSAPPLPAYVVIKVPQGFYMIKINDFVEEMKKGDSSVSLLTLQSIAFRLVQA